MIDVPRFIAAARSFDGVKYHHQGRSRFGLDCIGLAVAALAEQGVVVESRAEYGTIPQGSMLTDEIEASGLVYRLDPRVSTGQPGDVLVFTMEYDPQHVGIALEDGVSMIHAAIAARRVAIVPLTSLWLTKLSDIYRWR